MWPDFFTFKTMAKTVLHTAGSRGKADFGWLKANYSFSFANYYNPERMHFGVLRVLNDDVVDPGMGFSMHPHENMEIITIPLEGDLEHKDSMGNTGLIKHGDVQVMSAGTGIYHSERNKNHDKHLKLFQIWLFPNKMNVSPRYEQMTLNLSDRENKLQQIISPNANDDGLWIHQDAWFFMGNYSEAQKVDYAVKKSGNGMYVLVIKGQLTVEGHTLNQRDAIGIWDTAQVSLEMSPGTEVLIMDVPMG
jgi:redox-sensitive bicupin YhaK (pirin superfamily)